jgi:hypothetical protein
VLSIENKRKKIIFLYSYIPFDRVGKELWTLKRVENDRKTCSMNRTDYDSVGDR